MMYQMNQKNLIYMAAESATKVWEDYIKAHNEGDLEAITKLNFDDIKVWGPNGEFIDGSEAHINFLSMWFEGNSQSGSQIILFQIN